MELLKLDERLAEFVYGDIKILFRARASVGDKYKIDTNGEVTPEGGVRYNVWDFYKQIIKTFVVGWEGVTEDGKPVPYSYDALMTRLPTGDDDFVMRLAVHVAETTGMVKKKTEAEAQKNA